MPPLQAAVEATQEIGLAVMATTLSLVAIFAPVGFMSGMVGRFMAELRPDDGLRGAGVAVRQLHAHADDVGVLAEGRRRRTRSAIRSTTGCSSRSIAATRACSNGRWRIAAWSSIGDRAGAAVERAAVHDHRRSTSRPRTISRSSTSRCGRPRAPASRRWTCIANRLGAAVRKIPEVDFTLTTVAGDAAGTLNTATILVRLHEIEDRKRDQFAVMSEVRDHILPDYVKAGIRTAVSLGGGPGGGGGGDPVHGAGSRSGAAREVQRGAAEPRRGRFPAWSTSTPPSMPASPRCRCCSIGRRRPTLACRSRTRPRRCGCSSPAIR